MDKDIKQNPKIESSIEPQSKEAKTVILVSFWKNKKNLLSLAVILIVSFWVYLPSLQNEFLHYDDNEYFYENPHIINISGWEDIFTSVKEIFTTDVNGSYKPLVILSFAFEKVIYGFNKPEFWHLTNIILHLLCVVLVFRIALALNLTIIPAAFCALLFGIHPMRVESVAWVTERKDVLYGVFFLAAFYNYIKFVKFPYRKFYLLITLICFILSLLAKIQAVTLPLSMLLVDYYFGRRMSLNLVLEKWVYFLLSLARGSAGIYFLKASGNFESNLVVPLLNRILMGFYSFVTYIAKSAIPYEMVPLYPIPQAFDWKFYASMVVAFLFFGALFFFYKKQVRNVLFGLLFFTFNVMFLLQFKISGNVFSADRYTYIAYFGLFFVYALGFQWVLKKYNRFKKAFYFAAGFILVLYGYLNFEQNKIWKNDETLWSHTIKHYPQFVSPYLGRATYYTLVRKFNEALGDFEKAVTLEPDNYQIFHNRGLLYLNRGVESPENYKLALHDFTKAIQLFPKSDRSFFQRGVVYLKLKRFNDALNDFNSAEGLNKINSGIYLERSKIYTELGQYDEAQSDIEKYLSLNPQNASMWANLGEVMRGRKLFTQSLHALNKAIELKPADLDFYHSRLKTYFEMGDMEKARNDLHYLKSKKFTGIYPEYEKKLNPERH
jgi:tetratricopeptide (TPR) repeat protein